MRPRWIKDESLSAFTAFRIKFINPWFLELALLYVAFT